MERDVHATRFVLSEGKAFVYSAGESIASWSEESLDKLS